MSLSICMKEDYEEFHDLRSAEKQSQSVNVVQRLPRPFGPRKDIRISVPLCLSGFVTKSLFEKTNPIYAGLN